MSTEVRVKFNKRKVLSRDKGKINKSRKILINQIVKDTTPYVPMQDDFLYLSAIVNMSRFKDKIVWAGPYARFLYEGKLMVGRITRRAWAKKGETKVVTSKALKYGKTHPRACAKWYEISKGKNLSKWIKVVKEAFKHG